MLKKILKLSFHLQGSASWVTALEAKRKRHVLFVVRNFSSYLTFYRRHMFSSRLGLFYNLFSRYQPLPYGTHWTWPDVHWETPGPAFEQNTMLLLSDSMDRLLNPSIHSH